MDISPLSLQKHPSFDYTFKNITLLYEALTHSFDNPIRKLANGNVFYTKKTFYRLKTLGVSVFKVICSEQAILEHEVTAGPGDLTKYVEKLHSESVLKSIGKLLQLREYVEVANGYPLEQIENFYPDVIKALFGAVFVDVSNYKLLGNPAILTCKELMLKMFRNTNLIKKNWKFYPFDDFFPNPKVDVLRFLYLQGLSGYNEPVELEDPNLLYGLIGYKFGRQSLLMEAMTHGSIKQYESMKSAPDYQRLEFLGDAIYELVICEYLYWYFINDDKGDNFNRKEIEKYTNKKFQKVIAEFISLGRIILKPSHVEVENLQCFLESLVGAVYVDSWNPWKTIKRVLINLINECKLELLNSGCSKLPHSIQKCYTTKYRLMKELPTFNENSPDENAPAVVNGGIFIRDVTSFMKQWEFFSVKPETHRKLLEMALEEAEGKMETSFLSMDACNRAEFKRKNLYGAAAQKLLEMKYEIRAESKTVKKYEFECAPISANLKKESNSDSELHLETNEITAWDALKAFIIICKFFAKLIVLPFKVSGDFIYEIISSKVFQICLVLSFAIQIAIGYYVYTLNKSEQREQSLFNSYFS